MCLNGTRFFVFFVRFFFCFVFVSPFSSWLHLFSFFFFFLLYVFSSESPGLPLTLPTLDGGGRMALNCFSFIPASMNFHFLCCWRFVFFAKWSRLGSHQYHCSMPLSWGHTLVTVVASLFALCAFPISRASGREFVNFCFFEAGRVFFAHPMVAKLWTD